MSDVHANIPQLRALRDQRDELWVLGDRVSYGPHSNELGYEHTLTSSRAAVQNPMLWSLLPDSAGLEQNIRELEAPPRTAAIEHGLQKGA